VLHSLFEEDVIPLYEEHAEAKSSVRTFIYNELYDRPYNYATGSKSSTASDDYDYPDFVDAPVRQADVKPYIEPTHAEELTGVLDPPMGG
jgi:hypothetical protein